MRSPYYILLLAVLVFVAGCTPPSDPVLDLMDTDLRKTKVDDLSRTMGFIFSQRRFEQQEFESKVSSGLNRWITYTADKATSIDWKLDPLVEPTLQQFTGLAILDRMDDLSFVDADAYFIQQSSWVGQVVKRSTEKTHLNAIELYRLAADDYKPTDDVKEPIDEVVRQLNPTLDNAQAAKLASAFKYFDWIIRNIQLLPTTDHAGDDIDELRLNDADDLAAAGVAGTGYQRYPWQTLVFARGDYVDRAKLFMVGLQHLGLDSLMLAVKSKDSQQSQPWVVAVLIGDEFYLFDTRLGLAIPGEKLGAIATLSEVRANPNLIERLDLTVEESLEENTNYGVTGDQLEGLVGLIYVSPEGLSRRMKVLETRLVGDERLPLTNHPAELKKRLPENEKLEIQIWDTAFKTHQFRQAVREALKNVENNLVADRLRWYFQDEAYIDGFTRYRTARARFFSGQFETERNSNGFNAIESFENLMYTDQAIEELAINSQLQMRLGILKPAGSDETQNAAEFNRQLHSVQAQMRLVRRDTGLFLAQAHFDNGSVSAAANWLRVLKDKEDADRWIEGTNYLLARALESRKEYDLAIKQYRENPKAVQAHGNLIRVRLLSAAVKKVFGDVEL